ncbi:MAG: hypothetical protein WBH40_02955 [Ignavibacteriaceae bacterium]
MKRLILVFLFVGIAAIYFGCSENNPSAPELNQNDQVTTSLEKKVYTYFSGKSTNIGMLDPGKTDTLPNGRVQTRGLVVQTEDLLSDSRVAGIVTWVVNRNVYVSGDIDLWGTGELIIPDAGRWDMTYKGWWPVGETLTYEVDGHGKGELRGLKAHWTYILDLSAGIFDVNGYIIEK